MNQEQWEQLKAVVNGELLDPLPVGFIIDSPWLPNWAGASIMDYFESEDVWFESNRKALERFPSVWFLPGFWSEFAMCTEPSAFGAKCVWHENDLPFAERIVKTMDVAAALPKPRATRDGLAPFAFKRLERMKPRIEAAGHQIRFAVARGPLNIATFLLGNTEFLMGIRLEPEMAHAFLKTITDYLVESIQAQKTLFPSIDGILLLDDIVGFVGKEDMSEYCVPYLKQVYESIDVSVRFFHNDAHGIICAPYLKEIGINLFNWSHNHSVNEIRELVGPEVTLFGNVPPRDTVALGTPDAVESAVADQLASMNDKRRVILSVGGGMCPGTPTKNIEAFLRAAGHKTS